MTEVVTHSSSSAFQIVQIFVFLMACFIRETVCLIILFLQVAQVNEAGNELVLLATKSRWTEDWIIESNDDDIENSRGDDIKMTTSPLASVITSQVNKKIEKISELTTETERLSLALAASHHIIGSQVFSCRPSKQQLMLQIAGVVFTICFSVLIRIIVAWVS